MHFPSKLYKTLDNECLKISNKIGVKLERERFQDTTTILRYFSETRDVSRVPSDWHRAVATNQQQILANADQKYCTFTLKSVTLPIAVHKHFCKPYSVAHVKHGWTVAHLTMCVGRDCGNVVLHCCRPPWWAFILTWATEDRVCIWTLLKQLLLDGHFCKPYYIWLPHSCLCQTDIWKSFEMVRSGSVRKMHSDDGRMIKFIISFGSDTETCFWRNRHVWLPDSPRRSNNYIRSAWELLALKLSYS